MSNVVPFDLNSSTVESLIKDILDEALRQGATHAEVEIALNKGFSVTTRLKEIETVEYNQDKVIEITVYIGQRTGSASLSDMRPDAIRSAVAAACNIARFTDEDTYAGLADRELLAFGYPTLELSYPWSITVDEAIKLALACETIALQQDKRIVNSEGVTVSTTKALSAYGNTQGFIGSFPVTRHEISCILIAKEGADMQRDHSYSVATDATQLESIETIAKIAAKKTLQRLGAKRLTTRQAPVIFIAEEARSLLGHFISAISGSHLYRKSSFLLDHLGQSIFPKHIKIFEQPHLSKALGSSPYDDDGVLTRPNVFVEDGILKSYVLGTYTGRKLGLQTTGNAGGVHNLFISTSDKNLPALLKTMGKGLLVTELMGHGINLVTGDYSRGAAGFWVEHGEIQFPVEEITIAGNLRNMYSQLIEVGNDVDHRGNIKTGSLLLENMTIAGD